MSDIKDSLAGGLAALRSVSAVKVAEIGAGAPDFIKLLIDSVDWAEEVQVHAFMEFSDDNAESAFDDTLNAAGRETLVKFRLDKYRGTETERLDAMLEVGGFDGVRVSSSGSPDSLLAVLMGCHESVRSGGLIVIDATVAADSEADKAVTSFYQMYEGQEQTTASGERVFQKS